MYYIALKPSISVVHHVDSTTVSSTTMVARRKVSIALQEVHPVSRNGSEDLIKVGRSSDVKNAQLYLVADFTYRIRHQPLR